MTFCLLLPGLGFSVHRWFHLICRKCHANRSFLPIKAKAAKTLVAAAAPLMTLWALVWVLHVSDLNNLFFSLIIKNKDKYLTKYFFKYPSRHQWE